MSSLFFLECYSANDGKPRRVDLLEFPAIVGRLPSCQVVLNDSQSSRQHARFELQDEDLILTDLGSTNGTFVNRERISQPTLIQNGDILHFASQEFLVRAAESSEQEDFGDQTMISSATLPNHFPTQVREFTEMLKAGMVCGFAQIIILNNGDTYGYELLGRGTHPVVGSSPYEMFQLAQALDLDIELSELLRQKGFAEAEAAGITAPLFFNSHPRECQHPERLLRELERLRKLHPSLNLVFEVHEAAVTDLTLMSEMKTALKAMDIRLAYDDFGAGQARLLELAEVPPDILKFDISLIAGLSGPDTPKYRLLDSLNAMVKQMGIQTLAEGIETESIAQMCRDIGIDLFQGFHFGRPEPLSR